MKMQFVKICFALTFYKTVSKTVFNWLKFQNTLTKEGVENN